jgi:hypothetical protein
MKVVTRLSWENVGPAQMKAAVKAGYTTIPLLRKATEAKLVELVGPVKGANLFKILQKEGWTKATEVDLFVASPVCPSGVGTTRLQSLLVSESDMTKWAAGPLIAPKGWSVDALKEFQETWRTYEQFRKTEWNFLEYPYRQVANPSVNVSAVPFIGSVVFSGFRDADLEAKLVGKGYKVVDAVKADTKAVLIADTQDPLTYTSTKIDKAKKIPGCKILRKTDWGSI